MRFFLSKLFALLAIACSTLTAYSQTSMLDKIEQIPTLKERVALLQVHLADKKERKILFQTFEQLDIPSAQSDDFEKKISLLTYYASASKYLLFHTKNKDQQKHLAELSALCYTKVARAEPDGYLAVSLPKAITKDILSDDGTLQQQGHKALIGFLLAENKKTYLSARDHG